MDMRLVGMACVAFAIVFASLRRSYFAVPYEELKRRAAKRHMHAYKQLVRAARHGSSVGRWITGLSCLLLGVGLILIVQYNSFFVSLLWTAGAVCAWLLVSKKTFPTLISLAVYLAPVVDTIWTQAAPLGKFYVALVKRLPWTKHEIRTDIYEREDLEKLIRHQKRARNNRIDHADLDHALHALEVRTKKIKGTMVPFEKIHFVNMKEPIGPILLSELHKSNHTYFPVQGNARHKIIGIVNIRDLGNYAKGKLISNAMDSSMSFVHEDRKLEQVLQAYTSTGKNICMVVNDREQVVGLITVADVLEELYGSTIYTNFDDYNDPSRVAHASND